MKRMMAVAAFACLPGIGLAQPASLAVAPNSNMPADFYPHSPCVKPGPAPKGAPGVADQAAMQSYNLKVRDFNAQAAAFNACIRAYVDRAQNDMAHIQEIVHAAVTDANARE